ncbi:dihydrolipoamide dehydrogenase [Anaerosolibacter carboniphilus]|uniref:Dihydrolipoyl dehydrogenase n=1 Tax=Anaerosolibacter carboniphilus TaxID=1417629 RepID=A0A841KUP5_9FIRM|nr:dihydrolipoyl dehydrogenase [Anaerosolibacter carboniphilus]MBB6217424.1 dihydrolipoamide dehydrogenase [Anaerosolibacter carboniphilus]
MAIEIIMPKAGMAMETGTIIKWFKKEGEEIREGEPLLEILTDKVNMEVEANDSGILLSILRHEGEIVPVTEVIGYIGGREEKVPIFSGEKTQGDRIVEDKAAEENFDVVVIGGGPAGYIAAIKAAQLGGRVALIEKDTIGGTCLNRGCIPTKTYLKNAEMIEMIRHAKSRGILLKDDTFRLDMEKIVGLKNEVVKTLTTGVAGLLKSYDVKVYKGTGKLEKDKRVIINEKQRIGGKSIILATGSKGGKINIPGIESPLALTSDEILDLKEVPNRLVIIGGGVIGVELATIYAAYGSDVSIIEMAERIVPNMDHEISEELGNLLMKKGMKIYTNKRLERIDERLSTIYLHSADGQVLEADKALLSIGRVPDLDALGEVTLQLDRGKIKVNERMETSEVGIYAPGDINGRRMLAHAAFKMGEVAAINAMGGDASIFFHNIPSCIYTLPEVAAVGLTEYEAKQKHEISIGKFPFGGNGRALASGETAGFVKVIIDRKHGEILGVHILGPGAAEMINEAAALMEMEITAHEISEIVHGHPTFSEALMEACADSLRKCMHLPKK